MFYWLLKRIFLGPILHALFRPWVKGEENIPLTGGAILASNHLSFSDSFFLPLVIKRRVTFLAKADYFTGSGLKGKLTAGFFKGVGQLPVDRSGGRASEAALRTGLRVLRRGELLGIYPEGTRSPDGRLFRGKTGVARMALEGKVPVLPVAMIDTDKVQPIGRIVPKIGRVGVVIGAPLDFSRYDGMEDDRLVLRSITDEIMYELMKLSEQEYVDVYASTMKERLAMAKRARPSSAPSTAGDLLAEAVPEGGGLAIDPLDDADPAFPPPAEPEIGVAGTHGGPAPGGGTAPGGRSGPDEVRLWRAVDAFRAAALVYAVATFAVISGDVPRAWAGWLILAMITVWTGVLAWQRVPPVPMIVADLAIAVAAVLATRVVDEPTRPGFGDQTVPAMWAAAAVLAWGVWQGWRAGLTAAGVVALADLVEIGWRPSSSTIYNIIIVVLAGAVVGYAVDVFRAGRRHLARAVAVEATARERERLAADIHDSVLQVLAFVQRRAGELGGEAADLGKLAGEQEARLRALVAVSPEGPGGTGEQDVRAALSGYAGGHVTLIGPAEPVLLPAAGAQALAAATGAALDNVTRHAGPDAKAWILVEDEPDAVTVTVRDDGPGIPAGRLVEAETAGRLGVAASIRGRINAVGGQVGVVSVPGQGTEVEMRVPR